MLLDGFRVLGLPAHPDFVILNQQQEEFRAWGLGQWCRKLSSPSFKQPGPWPDLVLETRTDTQTRGHTRARTYEREREREGERERERE